METRNKIPVVVEYLKIHRQLTLDDEARKNLKPLEDWYKKNKKSRAKTLASQKIKNLEIQITELKSRIASESMEMIKKNI